METRPRHNVGYLAPGKSTTRHSTLTWRPNKLEVILFKRDLPEDHSDVVAGLLFRGGNPWQENLPGFRETCLAYADALNLALAMLPVYAVALHFLPAFKEPTFTLRLAHYLPQEPFIAGRRRIWYRTAWRQTFRDFRIVFELPFGG